MYNYLNCSILITRIKIYTMLTIFNKVKFFFLYMMRTNKSLTYTIFPILASKT